MCSLFPTYIYEYVSSSGRIVYMCVISWLLCEFREQYSLWLSPFYEYCMRNAFRQLCEVFVFVISARGSGASLSRSTFHSLRILSIRRQVASDGNTFGYNYAIERKIQSLRIAPSRLQSAGVSSTPTPATLWKLNKRNVYINYSFRVAALKWTLSHEVHIFAFIARHARPHTHTASHLTCSAPNTPEL